MKMKFSNILCSVILICATRKLFRIINVPFTLRSVVTAPRQSLINLFTALHRKYRTTPTHIPTLDNSCFPIHVHPTTLAYLTSLTFYQISKRQVPQCTDILSAPQSTQPLPINTLSISTCSRHDQLDLCSINTLSISTWSCQSLVWGVLLCGAHGDWGARFYGAQWRRVFVSCVSAGLQQGILRPDIYPPQASDLRPDSHQVR